MERDGALVPSTDGTDPAFKVDVYSSAGGLRQRNRPRRHRRPPGAGDRLHLRDDPRQELTSADETTTERGLTHGADLHRLRLRGQGQRGDARGPAGDRVPARASNRHDVGAVGTNERIAVYFGLKVVAGSLRVASVNATLDQILSSNERVLAQRHAPPRQDSTATSPSTTATSTTRLFNLDTERHGETIVHVHGDPGAGGVSQTPVAWSTRRRAACAPASAAGRSSSTCRDGRRRARAGGTARRASAPCSGGRRCDWPGSPGVDGRSARGAVPAPVAPRRDASWRRARQNGRQSRRSPSG